MELLPYSPEIEALDLGADVKAVGLEVIETESREPLRGSEAAQIWSAVLPATAGKEPWALDFFSHVDRVHIEALVSDSSSSSFFHRDDGLSAF